jgi:hypothetical protein
MRAGGFGGFRGVFAVLFALTSAAGLVRANAGATSVSVPTSNEAIALIHSTLMTLNDANATGNYSVLRERGAPDFQARFSADVLAALFKVLREKKVDLSVTALLQPVIEDAVFAKAQNIVQFYGIVPTRPAQLRFGFSYQIVGGQWKLYGLNLDFDAPGGSRRTLPAT